MDAVRLPTDTISIPITTFLALSMRQMSFSRSA